MAKQTKGSKRAVAVVLNAAQKAWQTRRRMARAEARAAAARKRK